MKTPSYERLRRIHGRSQRPRWLLALVLGVALVALPGCGVGLLLVGGTVAGIVLSRDSASRSRARTSGVPFLSPEPSRATLRERGSTTIIPICYQTGGARREDVLFEYALEREDFSRWNPAHAAGEDGLESSCPGALDWRWDAARDLLLEPGLTERVRVRVRTTGSDGSGAASAAFTVGNTPPRVELIPSSDDEGAITLSFAASDAEDDPLVGVELFHQVLTPDSPDRELKAKLSPELPGELAAPASGFVYSREWDSRTATGSHNAERLTLRLTCSDPFGSHVEARLELNLKNNHPPGASLLLADDPRDRSFHVPLPILLSDQDEHPVDVLVQYAREGEAFPALPTEVLSPDFRRKLFASPESDQLRQELQIATPVANAEEAWSRLKTSVTGVEHTFLWDTKRDLPLPTSTSCDILVTPFDEERGAPARANAGLVVDNDLHGSGETLAEKDGLVSGVSAGDLDGDGRADLALSLFSAKTYPDVGGCEGSSGRVDVYLRGPSGELDSGNRLVLTPEREAIEPCSSRSLGPLDLHIEDLDGDGRNDLVVLVSNCAEDDCKSVRGNVCVYFGRSSAPPLETRPDLVLDAGADVRALELGDLDGNGLLDLVVSNHENLPGPPAVPRGVGLFRQAAPRQFGPMDIYTDCSGEECEPGLLACGDLTGDGRDDIAVRQDEPSRNRILVLQWDTGEAALSLWTTVQLDQDDVDLSSFLPTCLALRDFDGDGSLDLAVGSRGASAVYVLLKRADRQFEEVIKLCTSSPPERLDLADLDGDGTEELVVLEPQHGGGAVEILSLRGGSCCGETCVLRQFDLPLPASGPISSPLFSSRDLTGDGLPDLVFGSKSGARAFVARGRGDLRSESPKMLPAGPARSLQDFTTLDLNGDGLQDLVTTASVTARSERRHEALVYFQRRRGGYSEQPSQVLSSRPGESCAFQSRNYVAASTNGDVSWIALRRDGGVDLFRGRGGQFGGTRIAALEDCTGAALPAGPLLLGEFGGSGDVDLLRLDPYGDAASQSGRLLLTALRNGGATPLETFESPPAAAGPLPLAMATGDFNLDGLDDLLLLHASTSTLSLLLQQPEAAWPSRLTLETTLPAGARTGQLSASDLNGDGRLDVLFVPELGSQVLVHTSTQDDLQGKLKLSLTARLSVEGRGIAAAAGDTNGDGLADVIVGVEGEKILRTFYQQGQGGLTSRSTRGVNLDFQAGPGDRLLLDDVTGDATPDLLLLSNSRQAIQFLEAR